MLFNSLAYLIFFPVIVLIYFLLPWQRVRNGFLLAASYYFYMRWDPRFIVLSAGKNIATSWSSFWSAVFGMVRIGPM